MLLCFWDDFFDYNAVAVRRLQVRMSQSEITSNPSEQPVGDWVKISGRPQAFWVSFVWFQIFNLKFKNEWTTPRECGVCRLHRLHNDLNDADYMSDWYNKLHFHWVPDTIPSCPIFIIIIISHGCRLLSLLLWCVHCAFGHCMSACHGQPVTMVWLPARVRWHWQDFHMGFCSPPCWAVNAWLCF